MTEAMAKQIRRKQLDYNQKSEIIAYIEEQLKKSVIGQHESSEIIADCMSRAIAGIRDPEKPILSLLFLGSTGVGKTVSVKVLADVLFGSREAFTRINCEELGSDHSFAKLVGSPPGYVGNDVEAMLSQKQIDKHFIEAQNEKIGLFGNDNPFSKRYNGEDGVGSPSIILFDEIEKAHPKIWSALIGIMDDGHLTLGNNTVVDMKHSIIIMTSNVGARELDKTLQGNPLGFELPHEVTAETKEKEVMTMKEAAIAIAKDTFPPEFCNRFDKIISFNTLERADFEKILDLHIQSIYKRLLDADMPIFVNYKKDFINMILTKGVDKRYGARNLNRVVDQEILTPFSKMINTKQIVPGDVIEVSLKDNKVAFTREPRYTKNVIPRKEVIESKPRGRPRKS